MPEVSVRTCGFFQFLMWLLGLWWVKRERWLISNCGRMIFGGMQPRMPQGLVPPLKSSAKWFCAMLTSQLRSDISGRWMTPKQSGGSRLFMDRPPQGARWGPRPLLGNSRHVTFKEIKKFYRLGVARSIPAWSPRRERVCRKSQFQEKHNKSLFV